MDYFLEDIGSRMDERIFLFCVINRCPKPVKFQKVIFHVFALK